MARPDRCIADPFERNVKHPYICYRNGMSDFLCLRFTEVLHLIGEPDFRDVRLSWEYGKPDEEDRPKVLAFQVHYCELQAWGQYRCRTKVLN